MFSKRKRIVGPQHHPLNSHRLHQKAKSTPVKHRGIDIEPMQVLLRRQLAGSVRNRMMLPRILQSSEKKCEAAASVCKADAEIFGQLVECAAKDHRHNAQLRLRWH